MSVLVTGAMGHVGYEIVKQAAAKGMKVIAQYNNTFRRKDAEALGANVTWVKCDLGNQFEVATLGMRPDIDGCIHSAAIANDKTALPQPLNAFASNVAATEYLLECARQRGWRRFILVSTGAVFQNWTDRTKAIPETEVPTPRSLYGSTKRCAEILTEAHANVFKLSAAVIRISWVFGPPLVPVDFDGPRGPIPEFLKLALRGEVIDEPSGGDFAASFTYVPDCAAGLLSAYEAEQLGYTTYNLGSGENYSTARVAAAVAAAVPGSLVKVGEGVEPWTNFTVPRGPLSCERMKEDFGFTPHFSLEAAIRDFADWMRANPDSYRRR
jgi:nucleoside-diphosphate-sugar epimerase